MMIWLARAWAAVLLYVRARWNVRVAIERRAGETPLKVSVDDRGDHVCQHGVAMDVHCCNCHNGFIFDRHHECRLPEPMIVGVDWAEGVDISVYNCRACGFETSIVEELLKHMKKHGATRLSVLPVTRPPAYRFGDRR